MNAPRRTENWTPAEIAARDKSIQGLRDFMDGKNPIKPGEWEQAIRERDADQQTPNPYRWPDKPQNNK